MVANNVAILLQLWDGEEIYNFISVDSHIEGTIVADLLWVVFPNLVMFALML